MPISSGDIQYRLSGGAANSDPLLSLGGAKSSVSVTPSTLWDAVGGVESAPGDTEYRCVYVHNAHGTLTLRGAKVWISSESAAYHAIALAGEGAGGTAETVADENTAPVGEAFSSPATEGAGLSLGDIAPGAHFPIWIRRAVPAAAPAASVTFTIAVKGDTDA